MSTKRPHPTPLVAFVACAGAVIVVAGLSCSQIIGADADVVECTVEQADRCNDGDPCTNDSCTRGACFHDQIAACGISCTSPADCDDGVPCTDDICYERSECRHAPKKDCEAPCTTPAECNDGSRCTTDVCEDGRCRNDPVDCSGLDGPCRKGVCSPVSGECTSDPCSTAVDPVTCTSYVCNEGTQQCDAILCQDDDGNPCTSTSCIGGVCTLTVEEFEVLDDTSPTDCIYDVYCDGNGVALLDTPADYEIPAEDGDPLTIEYCVGGRTLVCSPGTFRQPVCDGCTTVEDCPELPCQTLRGCEDTVCRYDGIHEAPHSGFCGFCRNGGCEVSPGVTCWAMEPLCCSDAGVCCGPNGCTDVDDMPLECTGCGVSTPCSYPVCDAPGGACMPSWSQLDDARCSGGLCAAGDCVHF